MAKDPKKREARMIRDERDAVGAQIEKLRENMKALSAELRDVEGPIPDRAGRPAKEAGYTIKTA